MAVPLGGSDLDRAIRGLLRLIVIRRSQVVVLRLGRGNDFLWYWNLGVNFGGHLIEGLIHLMKAVTLGLLMLCIVALVL